MGGAADPIPDEDEAQGEAQGEAQDFPHYVFQHARMLPPSSSLHSLIKTPDFFE